MLADILSMLYVAAGVLGNIAYLPTMRDLWRQKPAANLCSYVLWSTTSAIVFTYAAVINRDALFICLSALTLLFCSGIALLEFRRIRLAAHPSANSGCTENDT
ncbi:MAG: hypothetical protein NXI32_27640 [bacterium]|nr:hypothetical protein [bacterium]